MRYRCGTCGAVAEIDKETKTMTIEFKAPQVKTEMRRTLGFAHPNHIDCEFMKSVDDINISRLEVVEGHMFAFERSVS